VSVEFRTQLLATDVWKMRRLRFQ